MAEIAQLESARLKVPDSIRFWQVKLLGFSGGSVVKNPCQYRRLGFTPGSEDSLEEEIATPSNSILAWEIPWTKESRGLQSMGPQRVGHDSDLACMHI